MCKNSQMFLIYVVLIIHLHFVPVTETAIFQLSRKGVQLLQHEDLLENDYKNIISSWANIYKNAPGNGLLIIKRLFKKDPDIKTFFEDYITSETTEEEMEKNSEFKCHIIKIMHTSQEAIQNIRNQDVLMPYFIKIGDFHRSIGVQPQHLLAVQDVLMEFLSNDLNYDEEILVSWQKFIHEMTFYMFLLVAR